ncbi:MAG: glycosyltransferase [Lachnospira sp.]
MGYENYSDTQVKNQGLVLARKSGLQIATGEYITFVDADDYIDIDTYEKIVNNINYDICRIS